MKKIKENIFKGWLTSLLGLAIILAACYTVLEVPEVTWWPDGLLAICFGVVLLLAPQSIPELVKQIFGSKTVKIAVLLLIGAGSLALLESCSTTKSGKKAYQKAKISYAEMQQDTTAIPIEKHIEAEQLTYEINSDSLLNISTPLAITQGRASLRITRQGAGFNSKLAVPPFSQMLSFKVICDSITIRDTVYLPTELAVFNEADIVKKKRKPGMILRARYRASLSGSLYTCSYPLYLS